MAKDPAFLFYPGDYLRDTQCLSEAVQVAYDRIMCEHMRNICITQRQLNFFTKRLTEDQKEELLMVLTKCKGGYEISWVAESINKRKAYSESRRKNREGKTKEHMKIISKSYDEHMEIENEIENVDEKRKEKMKKFFSEMQADKEWEMLARQAKPLLQSEGKFNRALELFFRHVLATEEDYKDLKSIKRHFINWVRPKTKNEIS